MLTQLETVFAKSYGARLLPLASSSIKPGMLLEIRYHPWPFGGWDAGEIVREEGFIWDFVADIDPKGIPTEESAVNIINEQLSGKHSFAADASLPQYGVSVSAAFEEEFQTVVTITGVRTLGFKNGKHKFELRDAAKGLSGYLWDLVEDDLLVSSVYYITSFTARFHSKNGASAKAEMDKIKMKVGATGTWLNDSEFSVDLTPGAERVPLFVRGLRIDR